MLEIGLKFEQTVTVADEDTAQAFGSGTLAVYATPRMIALMENTAYRLVQDQLEDGKSTVGTLVNVKHVSATPVGMEIRCEAELTEIDRRRLCFIVRAYDEKGLIGEGIHERFIIDVEKFLGNTRSKLGQN